MANNQLAWGFNSLTQMLAQRPTQVGVGVVRTAIEESTAENNRAKNAILSMLCERTVMAKENFLLPGSGSLQPIDEFGIPLPVRPSGSYDVAYPIFGGGTAYGRNRVTAALETIGDINRDQLDAQDKDADWISRHLLAALFDNVAWTYTDPQLGALTVQPLAITSDSVTYTRVGGSNTTAQHYLAQSAAIADATNPYPTIYNLLNAYPSNQGRQLVSFINTAQVATTEALASFVGVTDPEVTLGSGSDTLNASGEALKGPGSLVLGRVSRQWVVVWDRIPSGYILSVVIGRPPLAMREYDDPALQGFFPEIASPDGARIERRYLRYAGFGVRNRISAAVTYVGSSASYSIPTGFDAPLAV